MQFVYESNVTVANRAKTSDNLSYINDFIGLGLAVSMVRREASNVKENWPTNGKTRSSYLCATVGLQCFVKIQGNMNAFCGSPATSWPTPDLSCHKDPGHPNKTMTSLIQCVCVVRCFA
jgi:hypothetical protein